MATAAGKIGSTSGSSTSGFSLDLAGSSSVSDVSLGTSAYIKNTTVNKYTTTGAVVTNTIVQALNDTMLNNGSGSGALNLAGGSAQGAAIGGAIAAAMSDNATLAYIYGTTMNNQSSVTVQALNGGSETVVALGVAGSKSNAASLSASVGIITDSATAYIESSTITGQSTGVNRALEVDAYQTTNIAIGGGSLYIAGGQAGVGIGLTYASIADPTGGNATDAHIRSTSISTYDTLLVMADSASVIAAGAASGGAGSNGLAGAIVVSEISPTTTAYISSGATVSIDVGRVTVLADSGAVSALDTALGNLVRRSNNNHLATDTCTVAGGTGGQNCIDFGAAALNGGTGNGPGASIISVAGLIQAGKNNVGASIVYDTIATTHSAYIANVLMTAGSNGNVSVSAVDSSKIQSVTIGFGLAIGQFAGVGGSTISSISNTVSAAIGNNQSSTTQSSVTARNISVSATDSSSITGTAAVAGASTQGSAAGLALVYSSIANNVSAGVTGSKLTASGNVGVGASSNASISTVAVGIAMSSQVGLAGSVATNLMGTNVTASITAAGTNGINGADVTATNNVGVIAGNNDKAAVFAGALSISKGAAGGAGSLVTNQITGTTAAYISGANTKVDALGTSSSDTLSVNNGTLVHAFDLGTAHAPTDTTPDLSENQDTVRGLAVVASSHQAVVTNVASLAASSSIAIMINPITNVMSGATRAYIDSAAIDTRLTSSTLKPQIEVAASSFSYSGAFGAGIAYGSSGGGGATIISTTMSRETFATITNATVGGVQSSSETVGAVTVKANAEQDASSIAIGFNTGSVGLNVFQATTEAYVDGGALTASSLTVNANNNTGIFSANGSGAYGSQAAIGAAFLVQVSSNRTLAYVGDEFRYQGNGAAHTTALNLSGALDVEATTKNRFEAYAIGGALSTGTAAIAGMANIEVANNTTIAGVYDTTLQGVTGGTAGAVTINATEDVAIKEIAGALAVGASGAGVGVGAAANVIVFKSQTIAESRNSNLNSSGAINVGALSTKEVLSYAVTAGIGGSVGIGATVGVIIIGTNTADADTQGQQTGQLNQGNNGTIASVNSGTNNAHGSGAVASGTAGNPNSANVSSTYDVSSVLSGGNDAVVAQIAGGNLTGTQVNVTATSANAAKMYLLGAGFAKNVGIGAGIGYTSVNSTVLANLSDYGRNGSGVLVAADTPLAVSAPVVTVAAVVKDATTGPYSGNTIDTEAIAGGAALYFGADAAVAVGNVSNSVVAMLGGQITGTGGTGTGAAVMAQDSTTQVVFT
ncbi:beta strand repeat-containing protein, partial [Bradyrhizobium sp. SHOUNA76]|uniref:beta strand repeat-containing protein n=2 Tax=unclassified Bradyrhizobium TaxID=2631580 RepID=UPI003857C3C0|nr:leukotoxin LktA family filamentous adhesin [Bradyrhizobium sp. SHOUNA76]